MKQKYNYIEPEFTKDELDFGASFPFKQRNIFENILGIITRILIALIFSVYYVSKKIIFKLIGKRDEIHN